MYTSLNRKIIINFCLVLLLFIVNSITFVLSKNAYINFMLHDVYIVLDQGYKLFRDVTYEQINTPIGYLYLWIISNGIKLYGNNLGSVLKILVVQLNILLIPAIFIIKNNKLKFTLVILIVLYLVIPSAPTYDNSITYAALYNRFCYLLLATYFYIRFEKSDYDNLYEIYALTITSFIKITFLPAYILIDLIFLRKNEIGSKIKNYCIFLIIYLIINFYLDINIIGYIKTLTYYSSVSGILRSVDYLSLIYTFVLCISIIKTSEIISGDKFSLKIYGVILIIEVYLANQNGQNLHPYFIWMLFPLLIFSNELKK